MSEWGGAGEMMAAWRHEQSDVSGATVHNVRRGATQLLLKNHPPGATETRYFTEFAKVYDYAASDICTYVQHVVMMSLALDASLPSARWGAT